MPHIHEKIDFCAEAYIVYNNKVLLRIHDKLDKWLSVGWHIELNEDPNQAVIREVKEEVWLDIILYEEKNKQPVFNVSNKSLIPPQFLNRHPILDIHEHIWFVYFATSNTDKLKLSDTEVSEDCRWFTKEEILENKYWIEEDVGFYALQALEKLTEEIVK